MSNFLFQVWVLKDPQSNELFYRKIYLEMLFECVSHSQALRSGHVCSTEHFSSQADWDSCKHKKHKVTNTILHLIFQFLWEGKKIPVTVSQFPRYYQFHFHKNNQRTLFTCVYMCLHEVTWNIRTSLQLWTCHREGGTADTAGVD